VTNHVNSPNRERSFHSLHNLHRRIRHIIHGFEIGHLDFGLKIKKKVKQVQGQCHLLFFFLLLFLFASLGRQGGFGGCLLLLPGNPLLEHLLFKTIAVG